MSENLSEAAPQLQSFVERLETINEQSAEVTEDVKLVKAEAKAEGYDPKIMVQVMKLRQQDPNERAEHQAIMEMYCNALGIEYGPLEDADSVDGSDQLKQYIERLENLDERKKEVAEDKKMVKAEAKAQGFDTKIIDAVVKLRKEDPQERQERETVIQMYWNAVA